MTDPSSSSFTHPVPTPPPSQSLPPDVVQQFLSLQAEEIALRRGELSLRQQESTNSHDYAKTALEAQLQDYDKERQARRGARRDLLIFSSFIALLLFGFVAYALYQGKDAFAMEALKAIGYIAAGVLGGYGLGKHRARQEQLDSDQSEE
jgi:hypothetical protein